MTPASTTACPNCSAPATGKFCAECGAALGDATCGGCRAPLTPGAKFCHRCGTAAGATARPGAGAAGAPGTPWPGPARSPGSVLPWAIAGVALLALVSFAAARNFGAQRGSSLDGPSNALPQEGLDFPAGGGTAAAGGAGPRAPDISRMTPAERAGRLHDRVMRLQAQGLSDSVRFFLPMAYSAYDELAATQPLAADDRYHVGQIAEAAGDAVRARAQADTILRDDPTHLLGLALGVRAAAMRNDEVARRILQRQLVAAEAEEMAKTTRPEYEAHKAELTQALAEAKKS